MVVDMSREFKRYSKICETLRQVLSDTQSALDDICNNLQLGKEIKDEFIGEDITRLEYAVECTPVVLVYGQSCLCKAILINSVLEQPVLPVFSSQWRWVKFIYGHNKNVRLTLGREYEFVDRIKALDNNWVTVPVEDLQRVDGESPLDHCPTVEITLCNSVLRDNLQICVPPDCGIQNIPVVAKSLDNVLPVIIYAIDEDVLSDSSIQEIRKIKETYEDLPVLFVSISSGFKLSNEALTESERHLQECKEGNKNIKRLHTLRRQLVRLGYLNENTEVSNNKKQQHCNECTTNNLISDENIHEDFLHFTQHSLQRYLLNMAQTLSEKHNKCLRRFVLSAFDMAREIQITPRRISYAQEIELKLYNTLMKIASQKQEEISTIIQNTLQDMKSNIAEILEEYHSKGENSNFHQQSAKMVTLEIQQIVLRKLSNSVATKLVESVGCLKESFTGTLQRCLESLERNCQEFEGSLRASDAVKQIVTAAYNIDLNCSSSFSVVHTFMDRLRQLLHNLQLPWSNSTQPQCNKQWQLQIVADMVDSLSYSKLAKTISTQFQEHIKSSHDAFQSAMRSLDNQLSGQLEQTEEQRIAIRKRHAPRFARLALESTSLCDLIRWGMPKQIREIGRGQYGVVYSCEPWAGVNPCAYKSVVPPDDRHWNDLAMEFYYTRTIPNHARIVKLRGSIVDHSYGGGSSAAVLLVMERMTRDLYCGIKSGLPWAKRIQIAIDVVEGIRYLHSQGLIHRDIKLKNVLLDNDDRAKLTDFGFCIPEAMMSGSIVGTPIHMAPELLSGRYDSSVDVYAFGILFWYICAGKVRLPNHFEQFHSKEQLWTSVRRGVRPECLPGFDQACWNLMEQCWSAEPSERPLLGYVQPQLQKIQQNSIANSSPGKSSSSSYGQAYETDCFYNNYDYVQLREY